MVTVQAGVTYTAKDEVSDVVRKIADNQEKAANRARNSAIELQATISVGTQVYRTLAGAVSATVSAYNAQVKAEQSLLAAARRNGDFTKEQYELLQSSNAERQRTLGIGDEEQTLLQARLSAMGVANDQLDEATRLTLALAAATGSGLADAGKKVAKVLQGQVGELREYGIIATDVADATAKISQLYGVAEAQGATFEGRLNTMKASFTDLLEVIGKDISDSDSVIGAVQLFSDVLQAATHRISNGEGTVTSLTKAVVQFNQETFDSPLGAFSLLFPGLEKRSYNAALSMLGFTESLEENKREIAEGIPLMQRYATEILNAAEASRRAASPLLSDEEVKQRDKAEKERKKQIEERKRQAVELRKIGSQPSLDVYQQILQDRLAAERNYNETSARLTTEGLGHKIRLNNEAAELIRKNEEDAARRRAEAEERESQKRIEAAIKANEDLVEVSFSASESLAQGVIAAASGFAQAAEIEREAYERVHGAHEELTEDERILADASKQAAQIREQAVKQLAATAITEIGKVIAASVTQVLASGAVTAADAAQDANAKVGWPANLAVVPAVIGAITAIFAALATSFAKGGPVTGGTPGKDSVPAMLMPGERVLTVAQNQAYESMFGAGPVNYSGRFAEGGVVGRNAPGQSITIVMPQLVPERDSNFRRTMSKTVVPELSRLSRDGASVRDPRSFGPRG